MFKRILIPTDFTEKSSRALDIALHVGSKDGFEVTLLHVIEVLEGTGDDFKEFYDKLEKRARKEMDRMVDQYSKTTKGLHTVVVLGKRANEIVDYAYDHDMDLIVLSSHRIDGAKVPANWATLSYKVGIMSHCQVLMVK